MDVGRTIAGLKELMYHMMKEIRLNCKYGGKKQTNRSIVTSSPVYVFSCMVDDKMVIRNCQLEHNHYLSPKDRRWMVNYHSINDLTAGKITNKDKDGISIVKSYDSLLVESGGHDNITYNQRDVSNFYSVIERDNDCRLMNAFWSDARSRVMHKDCGDIITFDYTFLCNRICISSRIPFSPFVGVIHHGNSIVFAVALLSHEDTHTYVWVFNQWLKCMGNPPK
ncbi:Protein FAR1-RELATED SEQUENCE 3, partial [Bienertia sinuspersici]